MASWDEVRQIALALPEVEEGTSYGNLAWKVKGKAFAWERPLREKELRELGDAAPEGPVLGAWVEDLFAKEATLADQPEVYFTTAHFDGYAIVLIRLERIGPADLEEAIVEAWLARAPKRRVREYLERRRAGS